MSCAGNVAQPCGRQVEARLAIGEHAATVLTLIFLPALYIECFRVSEPAADVRAT
jgi:hypothetical protein